jgi:hypothetical protein
MGATRQESTSPAVVHSPRNEPFCGRNQSLGEVRRQSPPGDVRGYTGKGWTVSTPGVPLWKSSFAAL